MYRRNNDAQERFLERKRRDDEAPRLLSEVPNLTGLRFDIREHTPGNSFSTSTYVRRIVVEHAPARFFIACSDPTCRDGGHDLTREVMWQLQRGETTFEGDSECCGQTRMSTCRRVVHYAAVAAYA